MPDPTVRELTPDELELQTVDPANFPYVKQRGLLYWTGSAWAKWDGSSSPSTTTASAPTFVSVGVASNVVLAANTSRKGLMFTNTSTARVSLNFAGGAAVLDSGLTLYPGQTFWMDDRSFTTAAINGIASAAASNLTIQELT